MNNPFVIQDLNCRKDIGANCLLVQVGPFRLVVDSGMDPKHLGKDSLPNFSLLGDQPIDFIILTHSHLDHIGTLPILSKKAPKAPILVSIPTSLLAPLMLNNSYSVMCRQKKEKEIPEYPLFTKADVLALEKRFFTLNFGKSYTLAKEWHSAKITMYPAGHVLGAVSVLIEYEGRQLFITGDILFSDQNSLRGAQIPQLDHLDVLMLETTRGSTERTALRRDEEKRLLSIIRKTIERGGACLIPAFALGRIQELLVLMYNAKRSHQLPNCPIFCSGLGMSLINTFDEMGKKLRSVNFSRHILKQLNIKQLRRSKIDPHTTRLKRPAIYLLSSGMLAEHTPAYNIAACLLGDSDNSICFVGHCDPTTPGGKLLQNRNAETFTFEESHFTAPIKASIEHFDLSGHADRNDLYQFAVLQHPKVVVLTHGDPDARQWFADQFAKNASGLKVLDPEVGVPYSL